MRTPKENLIPLADGPPRLHERQITPGQLLDMQLGYVSNLGAEVELVATASGRTVPVTIAAVGRSFLLGETPDGSRLVTQEEMDTSRTWVDCGYITFYVTHTEKDDTTYEYERLSYGDVGLAPVQNESLTPLGWRPDPIWHLRWPET